MMILIFQCIPAKDHKTDSDRSEDGNDDDPDDWIVDVFFPCGVNIQDSSIHKKKDKRRAKQEPDDAEVFF